MKEGASSFISLFNVAYGSDIGNKVGLLTSSLTMVLVVIAIGLYNVKSMSNAMKDSESGIAEVISIVAWSMFGFAITAGIISIWGLPK